MGSIGEHFPSSEAAWRDADSLELLAEVKQLVCRAGYRVLDADCVIVAQEPLLAPHALQMRTRLAQALRVPTDCVGLKSTTTDYLGFEGRREGISAQAVVLLTRRAKPTEPTEPLVHSPEPTEPCSC
jgi:2-C-methyl-D-erythritol 2,4-cyclodiphosphate synthase